MSLRPFLVIRRITELSASWLLQHEIKGLLVDIDNTITSYHSDNIPDDILSWFDDIKSAGVKFAPYSNARAYRIKNFCDRFGINNPGLAIKPFNFGLGKALQALGAPGDRILLIGDQVFTDCLAGKFSKIRTVLVNPISTHEFPATKFMRMIEKLIGRKRWGYDELTTNDR